MSLPNAVLSHDTMPSLAWQKTLTSVLRVSGGLSTFGSVWIISEIMVSETRRKSTFHHLMLGMSICDALCSSWLFVSSWALPAGYWWGAVGNTGTCRAQGFFIHISLAVPIYNASIALYYMLKIKYNWKDFEFAKKVEPSVHVIAVTMAMTYTIIAISIGMYHPTGPICLDSYDPKLCDAADPQGEDCQFRVRWSNTFTTWWYTVVFLCMLIAAGAMAMVYFAVRGMEKKMQKWDFERQQNNASNSNSVNTNTTNPTGDNDHDHDHTPEQRAQQKKHTKKSRQVARVGFYYLAVFLVSWLPTFTAECILARVMANNDVSDTGWFVLFVVVFLVWPAQGFFNFLVYVSVRPRKQHQGSSRYNVSTTSHRSQQQSHVSHVSQVGDP